MSTESSGQNQPGGSDSTTFELVTNLKTASLSGALSQLLVFASSAFAQGLGPDGSSAFARAPGASSGKYVAGGGKVIGADPDANVRFQLLRDNASATNVPSS